MVTYIACLSLLHLLAREQSVAPLLTSIFFVKTNVVFRQSFVPFLNILFPLCNFATMLIIVEFSQISVILYLMSPRDQQKKIIIIAVFKDDIRTLRRNVDSISFDHDC